MKKISLIVFSLLLMFGVGLFVTRPVFAQTFPAGCSSAYGYSSTTGMACSGTTTILNGCSSTAGFSTTTGQPCNGATTTMNGYNGWVYGANGFLNGCSSALGYSTTTGYACNMVIVSSPGTGTTSTTPTPGLPTTGAGGNAPFNAALLILSGILVVTSLGYGIRAARG